MADYPTGVYTGREVINRNGVVYDAAKTKVLYAEDINGLNGEVNAIEVELGASPKGTAASVAERIKGLRSLSDATADRITIKGDNVGLGTNTPLQHLHINWSSLPIIRLDRLYGQHPILIGRATGFIAGVTYAPFSSTDLGISVGTGNNIGLAIGGVPGAILKSNGRFGIRTGDNTLYAYCGGVIHTNLTSVFVTLENTDTDLMSYTLPAGALANDGDYLEVEAVGYVEGAFGEGDESSVSFYWGTSLVASWIVVDDDANWHVKFRVYRRGSALQTIVFDKTSSSTIYIGSAQNLANTVTIKAVGRFDNDHNIVKQDLLRVSYFPAQTA